VLHWQPTLLALLAPLGLPTSSARAPPTAVAKALRYCHRDPG